METVTRSRVDEKAMSEIGVIIVTKFGEYDTKKYFNNITDAEIFAWKFSDATWAPRGFKLYRRNDKIVVFQDSKTEFDDFERTQIARGRN